MVFLKILVKFRFVFGQLLTIFLLFFGSVYARAMSYEACAAKGCVCQSASTGTGLDEYWCQAGTEPVTTASGREGQCTSSGGTWVPGDSSISGTCSMPKAPIPTARPSSAATTKTAAPSCASKCQSMSESAASECLRRCNGGSAQEASQTAAPATPSPEQLAQQCISQAQAAISSCNTNSQNAMNTCDTDNNASLKGAASNATLALGQATGSSVQAACSNMGGVSQGANAGLAAYRTQCSGGKQACTNSCGQARSALENCANQSADPSAVRSAMQGTSEYQQVSSNNRSCAALQTKIEEANQAISNYANTAANSEDCASATSAGMDPSMDASQAGDPNSAYCQAHPRVASCVVDCSKPSMASNPTCGYLKNPYAGSGSSLEKSSGVTATGGGYAAPAAASGADLKLGGDPAWMGTPDLADRIAQARSGASEAIGGKAGNSANVGASGGGPGGAPARKGGPVLDDGPYGAGGGSGFYGSGGGGSGGGSAYAAATAARDRYMASTGVNPRGPNAPDLRQFLPGGAMDPRRKMVGMNGGPDGITGPNSNIWQKVQNRYRVMSNTLLP